jgi:hypothetical protein
VSTEDANLRSASSRGLIQKKSSRGLVMIKKKNSKHQFFYVPVKSLVIGRLILQFQKGTYVHLYFHTKKFKLGLR